MLLVSKEKMLEAIDGYSSHTHHRNLKIKFEKLYNVNSLVVTYSQTALTQ